MISEALLYEKLENDRVRCFLCAHRCTINPGHRGVCGVRENKEGVLYSLVFGSLIAGNIDPIEKKPFFHVYPASASYSIATVGCNFRCEFCQNFDISQVPSLTIQMPGVDTPPAEVTKKAKNSGCRTIAYTYTEPTVYFETALETAKEASRAGLENLFVTNGYMTKEAIDLLAPYLAAANVDLKSFRDEFYRKRCKARLQPVLQSLETMKEKGIWLEITTLLIPGLNDSDGELKEIAAFIRKLGAETPWHISRFYPQFRMLDRPGTPVSSLHRACEIGKEAGLYYVYSGNIPGDEGENTYCAGCSALLIHRYGYKIIENKLTGGACPSCGRRLDGLF